MIFLDFKISPKESPFLKISKEFRERCAKKRESAQNETIVSGWWGNPGHKYCISTQHCIIS